MTDDERDIRKNVAAWMAATKAGNTDQVLSLMTSDALFLTPGNAPMTKDDFAKASQAQSASGMQIEAHSEIQEVQVSGDLAFVRSHIVVKVTPSQGDPIERAGHTLTIFRKQDGQWLLARDANLLAPGKK